MAMIRSNPEKTEDRIRKLQKYVRSNLISDDGNFICSKRTECQKSRGKFPFHPGQMSYVGRHYDLEVDGRCMRIAILGQEYGQSCERVDLAERSNMIACSARKSFKERNPHMRGVTSTLRLLLGRESGTDPEGERILDDGHIFDGFALVNYLLCTALKESRSECGEGAGKGNSSGVMQRNCARHFQETMKILEPTVIVAHGIALRQWMAKVEFPERMQINGNWVDVLTFAHPSAGGNYGYWGQNPDTPYLTKTVSSRIKAFQGAGICRHRLGSLPED